MQSIDKVLRLRIVLISSVGIFILFFLPTVFYNIMTQSSIYTKDIPTTQTAIVFGAGVWPGGQVTPYLRHRLEAAYDLYSSGKVTQILVSGDNSIKDYDEPTAMRDYLIAKGVPPKNIIADYAGFDTYDTCYRAANVFGLKDVTIVTHGYHMPRAVTTCESMGIKVVGYPVEWGKEYTQFKLQYLFREMLATNKSVLDNYILHPEPTFAE
jgi:vancomycin permeability regulator SanA